MDYTSRMVFICMLSLGYCERKVARCDMQPNTVGFYFDQVNGTVTFEQEDADGAVTVTIEMSGFNTSDAHDMHGIHVHTDPLSTDEGNDCYSSGPHYNPDDNPHGGPQDPMALRHAGDLGNVVENADGTATLIITDSYISLQGQYNVIGRTFDVHQMVDTLDDSIDSSGGSGERLACCTIYEYTMPTGRGSTKASSILVLLASLLFVSF